MSDLSNLSKAVFFAVEAALPDNLEIAYEYMPADPEKLPALSMQTLTGDPVERRYVDGSYIGRYRFAIYLRQASEDDTGRLDAVTTLEQKIGRASCRERVSSPV